MYLFNSSKFPKNYMPYQMKPYELFSFLQYK